jgi:hypothetical protein
MNKFLKILSLLMIEVALGSGCHPMGLGQGESSVTSANVNNCVDPQALARVTKYAVPNLGKPPGGSNLSHIYRRHVSGAESGSPGGLQSFFPRNLDDKTLDGFINHLAKEYPRKSGNVEEDLIDLRFKLGCSSKALEAAGSTPAAADTSIVKVVYNKCSGRIITVYPYRGDSTTDVVTN